MTILLVEDHQDTREAMHRLLQRRGHTVFEASDIASARTLARDTVFDLLVCDLQLPDGDGCQLMQELSSQHDILGLAISGHCAASDRARSSAAGFTAHLAKPCRIEEVQSALALAQRELQRQRESRG